MLSMAWLQRGSKSWLSAQFKKKKMQSKRKEQVQAYEEGIDDIYA